jgi:hypothetical protein
MTQRIGREVFFFGSSLVFHFGAHFTLEKYTCATIFCFSRL